MQAHGICDLYFPTNGISHIRAPTDNDGFCAVDYSLDLGDNPPMFMVSVANCFLQFLFNLRDSALSCNDNEMGGFTKIACVTVLSLTACIGYTALNILEIPLRALATLVLSVSVPIIFFLTIMDVEKNETIASIVSPGFIGFLFSLFGTIQGTAQLGAGFFAAYKMATYPGYMPQVDELTETATCGIPKSINTWIFKALPDN